MTLRDWLAGNAMAGFTRARDTEMFNEQTTAWYARIAYQLADAMLEERKRDRRAATKPPQVMSKSPQVMPKPPWHLGKMTH